MLDATASTGSDIGGFRGEPLGIIIGFCDAIGLLDLAVGVSTREIEVVIACALIDGLFARGVASLAACENAGVSLSRESLR